MRALAHRSSTELKPNRRSQFVCQCRAFLRIFVSLINLSGRFPSFRVVLPRVRIFSDARIRILNVPRAHCGVLDSPSKRDWDFSSRARSPDTFSLPPSLARQLNSVLSPILQRIPHPLVVALGIEGSVTAELNEKTEIRLISLKFIPSIYPRATHMTHSAVRDTAPIVRTHVDSSPV